MQGRRGPQADKLAEKHEQELMELHRRIKITKEQLKPGK